MGIIDTAKAYPKTSIAIVAVVGLGVLWFMASGSSAPQGTAVVGGYADGTADQQMQLSMATLQAQSALQAQASHDTTSLEMAKLALEAENLNYQTQRYKIENDTAVAMQASTLNAQVLQAQLRSSEVRDQIAATTQVQLTEAALGAQTTIIKEMQRTQRQAIQASQEIATQSWFDSIFG
jgi:hypothetical protein